MQGPLAQVGGQARAQGTGPAPISTTVPSARSGNSAQRLVDNLGQQWGVAFAASPQQLERLQGPGVLPGTHSRRGGRVMAIARIPGISHDDVLRPRVPGAAIGYTRASVPDVRRRARIAASVLAALVALGSDRFPFLRRDGPWCRRLRLNPAPTAAPTAAAGPTRRPPMRPRSSPRRRCATALARAPAVERRGRRHRGPKPGPGAGPVRPHRVGAPRIAEAAEARRALNLIELRDRGAGVRPAGGKP